MLNLAIVQARLGSSRLPGKTLLPLGSTTVLGLLLERIKLSPEINQIVLAVPDTEDTEVFELIAKRAKVGFFRGSELDLLDRHYQAAKENRAEVILKIPSDCPLIDPQIISRGLGFFRKNSRHLDYMSNLHPQSYPDGNDVEIFSFDALEKSWREAGAPFQREHTTPYIWDNPQIFRIGNFLWETGWDFSKTYRYTLDYPADYEVIRAIYENLVSLKGAAFSVSEICTFLQDSPEVTSLNAHLRGDSWYQREKKKLKHFHRIYHHGQQGAESHE